MTNEARMTLFGLVTGGLMLGRDVKSAIALSACLQRFAREASGNRFQVNPCSLCASRELDLAEERHEL
jgi:hypothetical protein